MKSFQEYIDQTQEIGFVEEVVYSLAYASGLPHAKPLEVIVFETGETGQVLSLSEKFVEIMVFSKSPIRVGTRVARTNTQLEIPVGKELLGNVIDPLGNAIDPVKPLKRPQTTRPIDVVPGSISTRVRIQQPCETGVTIVDLMIPLGKGQRELIIGDQKSGKSSFLLKTILAQAKTGSICIYATIGKKKIDIKKMEEFFTSLAMMKQVIIIGSTAHDPPGIIYITPYTAMTIAEYFRDEGYDVLLVLDDLSTHAKFYREISLLGKRFPGRNSYPGDIFYTHAKLLERAGNFKTPKGEHSITCLPIVETIQGDFTGYIQTNVMSMTDGHIFFDGDLFAKGRRPAINPTLSVTRVGKQTQTDLKRAINRELVSFLTLYEKMQSYVHFGAELSDSIKLTIATGERIIRLFEQSPQDVVPVNAQIILFTLLWAGAWNDKEYDVMKKDMEKLTTAYSNNAAYKKTVDQLITSAKGFNEFLGVVRKSTKQLMQTN